MRVSNYLKESSHPFYGSIISLVMLSLYEILIIWTPSSGYTVRNGPDVWFREVLLLLGVSSHQLSFALITLSLVAIVYFYDKKIVLKNRIFVGIIVESIFLALVSGALIHWVISGLLMMSNSITGSVIGDLGLSIGAGLFEELFFRVFLTTVLIWGALGIFKKKVPAIICAVLIASFIFSAVHYVGFGSDEFEGYSFLFRFFAGIWFTTIYSVRGFAVVSLTHAFYDIFVLVI
ncbi:MAG: CPBP family intramembrane metalloprotease [Proteobacteria bacterium]|nr:CPBP family intramembrane metalloprotease [Pseudomonadota bacterium]